MKIKDWENYIFKKYKVVKTGNIQEIKKFYPSKPSPLYTTLTYKDSVVFIFSNDKVHSNGFLSYKDTQESTSLFEQYLKNFGTKKAIILKNYCDLAKTLGWEEKPFNKLNIKAKDFYNKQTAFSIEKITENEIADEYFYSAYIFDENFIASRQVVPTYYMGTNTLIVFLESKDNINISQISIRDSGGLSKIELNTFYDDMKI